MFVNVIAEIITGLEAGNFEAEAAEEEWAKGDEDFQGAVNVIAEILDGNQYNKWHLLAVETYIRQQNDPVMVDEIEDYLEETFLCASATVASALEEYAAADSSGGELGELYEALDKAGGVDRFDWGAYAEDGMTPTSDLSFIEVPAAPGEPLVYLFRQY